MSQFYLFLAIDPYNFSYTFDVMFSSYISIIL